jgi:hypothetical protein
MKKILFWLLFLPAAVVMAIAITLQQIGEFVEHALNLFEGWCFDYREAGWERKDGFWIKK